VSVAVSRAVSAEPVEGIPEVAAGDDLAGLIAGAASLRAGDVVVVAQKIVSKAEGATERLRAGETTDAARRRLAAREAARVVAQAPWAVITETRHGFVCANAGVDASNVAAGELTLLPADPDGSAGRLRSELTRRIGVELAVVVTDTFGRPWRLGQTDVAIGVAGLPAIRDARGEPDRNGRTLGVTEVALADEVAAAGDLARTKAGGHPVVIVRGLDYVPDEAASARDMVRPADEDLFRRGRGGLAGALGRAADPSRCQHPVDDEDLAAVREAAEGRVSGARVRAGSGQSRGSALPRPGQPPTEASGPSTLVVAADGAHQAGLCAGLLVAGLVDRGYVARLKGTTADEVIIEAGR
jgi:coenzyme F420-0:L-glutamate ligase/coenzyme F420-1:gamma-L-glutamate ligase